MDPRIFRRRRLRRPVLTGTAAVAAVAVAAGLLLAGGDREEAAVEAPALAPLASAARTAPAPLRAFMDDCGDPAGARERIRVERFLERVCVARLSAALAALAAGHHPVEAREALGRHRAAVEALEGHGWDAAEEAARVRTALVSAAEVIEHLAGAADAPPELATHVSAAGRAARAIRPGMPLAAQTARTDAFFRHAAAAAGLLAGGAP